jgi:hypothetical protein
MADLLPEKWMKGVAITTTVLAVLTAIASSRGSACTARTQILTALEGSQWAYFQAKSIKQHMTQSEKDVFQMQAAALATSAQKDLVDNKIKSLDSEIARYDKEKNALQIQAEKTGKDNGIVGRKGNLYSMSVVFFQIGIMLSSVGALLKRKEMWVVGLLFGLVAMGYLANGFFLFF